MATAPNIDQPEICASHRRPGADVDCYQMWIDGLILRVEAKGVWDIAAARAYCDDVRRMVEVLRVVRPDLRAIVDRSAAPVLEEGTTEILMATYADVMRAGDRLAMVVDNSLAKMRIRQIAGREETQAFLSVSAARTWVLAYS